MQVRWMKVVCVRECESEGKAGSFPNPSLDHTLPTCFPEWTGQHFSTTLHSHNQSEVCSEGVLGVKRHLFSVSEEVTWRQQKRVCEVTTRKCSINKVKCSFCFSLPNLKCKAAKCGDGINGHVSAYLQKKTKPLLSSTRSRKILYLRVFVLTTNPPRVRSCPPIARGNFMFPVLLYSSGALSS